MAPTDFETALNDTSEIELTTTGPVSRGQTSRPVWFVRQGERLYSTTAKPLTDPGEVAQVVDSFRAKYGSWDVAEYYPNPDVAPEIRLG